MNEITKDKYKERTIWQKIQFAMNSPYTESMYGIALRMMRAPLYIDSNHDHKKTVFMAGTGRSGTTWLSKVINYDNLYRYIHEPFLPDRVPEVSDFINGQYLREDNSDSRYIDPVIKIVEGRIRGAWVDRYNTKMLPEFRLIKAVRANLLVSWLHAKLPELPIVYTMRHPLAVTNSKLVRGWPPRISMYLQQDELIKDYLAPFIGHLEGIKDDFEGHVFSWCIENYIPLKQMRKGDIHFLFYEDLFNTPEREIERLFKYMGRDYDDSIFEMVKAPSPTSRKDSAIVKGDSVLASWQKKYSTEQIGRAVEILSIFGLDKLYSDSKSPNIDLSKISDDQYIL